MTAATPISNLSVASTVPQFVDPLPAVPHELKALPQWVMWRPMERGGRIIKMPISPIHPGAASSTNPAHWSDYTTAVAESMLRTGGGLGFVFSADDPYTGVDLDDCRNVATGAFEPWGQQIIDTLDSCTEVSPSGTGVKIWVKGTLPGDGKGRRTRVDDGEIEIYSSGRYFTVTGQHVAGTPITVEARQPQLDETISSLFAPQVESDGATAAPRGNLLVMPTPEPIDEATELLNTVEDDSLIQKARGAANGAKFRALWDGDYDHGSQSEADLALCSILAYWSSGDPIRVDRMFRRSALMRDKWDEKRGRQTYGEITVVRGCAGQLQRRADAAADDSGLPSLAALMSTADENDAGNAKRFREIFGQDVRYSRPEKKWLVWDGRRWAADAGGKVYQLAKRAMAEFLRQAVAAGDRGAENFAKKSLDNWRINAMLQSV
jgi:putative DNA primase/helicase